MCVEGADYWDGSDTVWAKEKKLDLGFIEQPSVTKKRNGLIGSSSLMRLIDKCPRTKVAINSLIRYDEHVGGLNLIKYMYGCML